MHPQSTKASGVCEHCGETFYRRFPSYVGRFCSKRCANVANHPATPPEIRFWEHVDRSGDCWLWTALHDGGGYGVFWDGTRQMQAHVFSWNLHNGEIPEGVEVCHNCPGGDTRDCVNPAHLWLGTHQENIADAVAKDRMARGDRHYRRAHRSPDGTYKEPETASHGAHNGLARLTDAQVIEIRALYATGAYTQAALAAQFGVHQTNISLIVNGKHWRHTIA
jgi:hypothetical protein